MPCDSAQQIACLILHAPRNLIYIDGWFDCYEYLFSESTSDISGYWLNNSTRSEDGQRCLWITGGLNGVNPKSSPSEVRCYWNKQYTANRDHYIQGERYTFNPTISLKGKIRHGLFISENGRNSSQFRFIIRLGAWRHIRAQRNWVPIKVDRYELYKKTIRETDLDTIGSNDDGEGRIPVPFEAEHTFIALEDYIDNIERMVFYPKLIFTIPNMAEDDFLKLTISIRLEFSVNGEGYISALDHEKGGRLITTFYPKPSIHMTLDENSDCYNILNPV